MISSTQREPAFLGVPHLSLRGLVIGALGSAVLTASSMYVALRMSALPWPTIFVAVLSMALLKLLGRTTLNEINMTQTAMSAGAMVAGGLAFTLPGLWITQTWPLYDAASGQTPLQWAAPLFLPVLLITTGGMVLGTLLTWALRPRFVERDALPYPIGAAAAETLRVGDQGGRKGLLLFVSMGLAAVFAALRDRFALLPAGGFLTIPALYARNVFVGIWASPMAAGIGYIIGPLYTGVWFLGAVAGYILLVPGGVALGWFADAAAAVAFKNTAGIGLMVGTGFGILLSFVLTFVKGRLSRTRAASAPRDASRAGAPGRITIRKGLLPVLSVALAYVLSVAAGLSPLVSLLLMAGVFVATAMSATITGQTGINPMEIFGIIVLLAIRLFLQVDTTGAFFIAAAVAVACGYAGDLLNDYKAGHVLGTDPRAQLISQLVGGVVGCLVAAVSLFAILYRFGGVGEGTGLTAAQAFAVTSMVEGVGDPLVFGVAAGLGALLYVLKVPVMTLGIGLYLPFEISAAVVLGGLIRFVLDRVRKGSSVNGSVVASGLLGGEGIAGVLLALFGMATGT